MCPATGELDSHVVPAREMRLEDLRADAASITGPDPLNEALRLEQTALRNRIDFERWSRDPTWGRS
jgi:hypothetical protein